MCEELIGDSSLVITGYQNIKTRTFFKIYVTLTISAFYNANNAIPVISAINVREYLLIYLLMRILTFIVTA